MDGRAVTDRNAVADALEEIGLLLELLGENPFKTRAYGNAARIVRGLDRDLGEVVARGELGTIKGIGPALVDKITTLVTTGRLPYLEGLRAQVPPGLLDWLRIPGLGPKKARSIHVTLGIETLEALEAACAEGRIRDLEGFGEASERKILEGIAVARSRAGRFLQPVVRAEAERISRLLLAVPGVRRVEVAGSVRRLRETSKDIDLVAVADDPARAMEAFVRAPGVSAVTGHGPTKSSVRLDAGPSADLRVVPEASFPFAWMYFTGSKAHNVAIRGRAQRLGMRLNEYALVRDADGAGVACADEAAIYRALGLDWIPPELREDEGEVERAETGTLPRLLEGADLRGVLHVHSNWSDGTATIREMADGARARGYAYLGLCDHSRSAAYAGGLSIERVREQHAAIDALNREYDGSFRVLKGIEVDILADGSLDYPDEVLASFEIVVGSIHGRFSLGRDEQTARLVRAIESGRVDVVGHPTGRLLLSRDGYALDLFRVIDAAAAHGVAIEINAHPQRLDLDPPSLRYGLTRGLLTSVNPDAHDVGGLDDVVYGVGVARRAGCGRESVLNARSIQELSAWLAARH